MKNTLLRLISSASKNPPSTQLRKLIILLLNSHIFLRKFWLNFAETSINKIPLNKFTKHLVLNKILCSICMISIQKTWHSRTMSMHVNVHEHSAVGLLVKLCKLALLVVSVFVVLYEELCCSDRRPGLGLCTFCLLKIDRSSGSGCAASGRSGNCRARRHQDSTLVSLGLWTAIEEYLHLCCPQEGTILDLKRRRKKKSPRGAPLP